MRLKAIVAGATGVVGRRLAEHLVSTGDWDVVGLARRTPPSAAYPTIAVDLTSAGDCREKLGGLRDITHILYAGRYTHTTQPEPIEINLAMMTNLIEALEPANRASLRHIHLVQGSKWYGSTTGPYKTPAREDDPRMDAGHTFYYAQQDWLEARQRGAAWTWSASRPHAVVDRTTGIARSLAILISMYAALCKEEGEPLWFPGTEGNYRALYQCTDARLLAKAIAWMSTEPRCGNHAFNIINGDYIRWMNLWPVFAEYFGMDVGPVRTQRLGETMPPKKAVWERIVRKHGLRAPPYEEAVLWPYGDFVFHPDWDIMSDTIKARQLGFHEVRDTQTMFIELFNLYRRENIIPAERSSGEKQ